MEREENVSERGADNYVRSSFFCLSYTQGLDNFG